MSLSLKFWVWELEYYFNDIGVFWRLKDDRFCDKMIIVDDRKNGIKEY